MEKKPIKMLIPVWGDKYIDFFLKYSVPSLLSAGNIPAIYQNYEIEIILLTPFSTKNKFLDAQSIENLSKYCNVSYIDIEDLIVPTNVYGNLYGFTLSLAYHRGILRFYDTMLDTYFIFLVCDYVYADGNFRNLAKYIDNGSEVIISASLRSNKNNSLELLKKYYKKEKSILHVPPRELVKIAFEEMHYSTSSKIVNSTGIASSNNQHLYWKVDDSTLIGKVFMGHMLCIKPKRQAFNLSGFCDYTYINELTSEESLTYIVDSDEFFVLEMQEEGHEQGFSTIGKFSSDGVARSLASWVTPINITYSTATFIFHTDKIPQDLPKYVKEANNFIENVIKSLLSNNPEIMKRSHRNHYHWTSGIHFYMKLRRTDFIIKGVSQPLIALLKESIDWSCFPKKIYKKDPRSFLKNLLSLAKDQGVIKLCLLGIFKSVISCMKLFIPSVKTAEERVFEFFKTIDKKQKVLIISELQNTILCNFRYKKNFYFLNLDEILFRESVVYHEKFDVVLLIINSRNIENIEKILDSIFILCGPCELLLLCQSHPTCSRYVIGFIEQLRKYYLNIEYELLEKPEYLKNPKYKYDITYLLKNTLLGNKLKLLKGKNSFDCGIIKLKLEHKIKNELSGINYNLTKKRNSKIKYNFSLQLWGKRYLDVFFSVGLPSQLAEGNIDKSPWLEDAIYEIYTTKKDKKEIIKNPLFKQLEKIIDIKFIELDKYMKEATIHGKSKWKVIRHAHQLAVKSADARKAGLFILNADQVWSKFSFTNAVLRIEEGYSAVLCAGPRAIEEEMYNPLAAFRTKKNSIEISSRELVKIGLKHRHNETKSWFWENIEYFMYPTYFYFEVPNNGVVAFCYILHPFLIKPEVINAPFHKVIDQDYLKAACPNIDKIYIVQDSDEICHIELSPEHMGMPLPPTYFFKDKVDALSWYAEGQYNSHHREFVKKPVLLHYNDITGLNRGPWNAVISKGLDVIKEVDELLKFTDKELLEEKPHHLVRRINNLHKFNEDKSVLSLEERKLLLKAQEYSQDVDISLLLKLPDEELDNIKLLNKAEDLFKRLNSRYKDSEDYRGLYNILSVKEKIQLEKLRKKLQEWVERDNAFIGSDH